MTPTHVVVTARVTDVPKEEKPTRDGDSFAWKTANLTAEFGRLVLQMWALLHIWDWFLVPLGVRSIGVWHMAGLLGARIFLVPLPMPKEGEEQPQEPSARHKFSCNLGYIAAYSASLAFLWAIHRWGM